jgi:hypothetical protein
LTLDDFRASLDEASPPAGLAPAIEALWWQGKGNWAKAHELAQAVDDADGAWVHAHLHRVEGDLGNAGYWYRRAGQPMADGPLQAEWTAIAETLLTR